MIEFPVDPRFISLIGLIAVTVIALAGVRLNRKAKPGASAPPLPQPAPRMRRRLDRRSHARASGNKTEILVRTADRGDEPRAARILDRSLGGLGVELKEKIGIGEQLHLRLREWAPEAKWVTVEVCYCRPWESAWRVGCRFVDMSAWEVINVFGPPDPDEE